MTADQFFARRFASRTTGASPLPSSSPSPYASSSLTSFDASASCSAFSQELLPAESSPLPVGYFPGEVDPAWGVGIKLAVPLLSQRQVEGLFAWLHLHPSVIHLAYPSCYLSVELAPLFARLLRQNTTLLSLQLSALSPSSSAQSGLLMVLRSLAFNCSLQYLDLRATGLETEACELLATSLRLNSSLRVLYLDSLCRRRLGLLAGGLKRNTGLQVLHIHSLSLKHLEPSLHKLLKAAARNPTLLHLHLPDLSSRSITKNLNRQLRHAAPPVHIHAAAQLHAPSSRRNLERIALRARLGTDPAPAQLLAVRLPSPSSGLARGRCCDLSLLGLSNPVAAFLADLQRLQHLLVLDLRHNRLEAFPEAALDLLPHLQVVHLSDNPIPSLELAEGGLPHLELRQLYMHRAECREVSPRLFLKYPCLQVLDLAFNRLGTFPTPPEPFLPLKELDLQGNGISSLANDFPNCPNLTMLLLHGNMLHFLPPGLASLAKVCSFCALDNPLTSLPSSLNLADWISVSGYLTELQKGAERFSKIRMVLLGDQNVGKTSLLRAMRWCADAPDQSCKTLVGHHYKRLQPEQDVATDGIAIHGWSFDAIEFPTWDFAGQEIYYHTHPFFLSKNCIFTVVVNLRLDSFQQADYWINSIQRFGSPIFIVGTHSDGLSSSVVQKKLQMLSRRYANFPITRVTAVSCSHGKGIAKLRRSLVEAAKEARLVFQPIPVSYMYMSEKIKELQQLPGCSIIPWSRFVTLASQLHIDFRLSFQLAQFLHETGQIAHYSDDPSLRGYVFLNPQLLPDIFSSIVTVKNNLSSGQLFHDYLFTHIWGGDRPNLPSSEHFPLMLRLLQKFNVLLPLPPQDGRVVSLVPSLITDPPPSHIQDEWGALRDQNAGWVTLCNPSPAPGLPPYQFQDRIYVFNFLPVGFFGRLLVRLAFSPECKVKSWKDGAIIQRGTNTSLIECQSIDDKTYACRLKLRLDPSSGSSRQFAVDCYLCIDSLIRSWDYIIYLTHVRIACPHCILHRLQAPPDAPAVQCHFFEYLNLRRTLTKNQSGWTCPFQPEHPVPIQKVLPEATLSTLTEMRIAVGELKSLKPIACDENRMPFVWSATYRDCQVAVKQQTLTGLDDEVVETYENFRREVAISYSLRHPNIVPLLGWAVEPQRVLLVTELFPVGNLQKFLKSSQPLDWKLRFRFAWDLLQGLHYLHTSNPPLAHRDLKSPNIFIKTLDLLAEAVLGIGDFGVAEVAFSDTVGEREVNSPQWLAPEAMQQLGMNTLRSDIFSFGIILWQMCSRKTPYSHLAHLELHPHQLEERIKNGTRPEPPLECWPGPWAAITSACWVTDPFQRPTTTHLLDMLAEAEREILGEDSHICRTYGPLKRGKVKTSSCLGGPYTRGTLPRSSSNSSAHPSISNIKRVSRTSASSSELPVEAETVELLGTSGMPSLPCRSRRHKSKGPSRSGAPDPPKEQIIKLSPIANGYQSAALDPLTSQLWLSQSDGRIVTVDPATSKCEEHPYSLPHKACGAGSLMSWSQGMLWVSTKGVWTLAKKKKAVASPLHPEHGAFGPGAIVLGGYLCIATRNNTLSCFQLPSMEQVASVTVEDILRISFVLNLADRYLAVGSDRNIIFFSISQCPAFGLVRESSISGTSSFLSATPRPFSRPSFWTTSSDGILRLWTYSQSRHVFAQDRTVFVDLPISIVRASRSSVIIASETGLQQWNNAGHLLHEVYLSSEDAISCSLSTSSVNWFIGSSKLIGFPL